MDYQRSVLQGLNSVSTGPGGAQPHAEPQRDTRASPLLKWHTKVTSGRPPPAAPGVLSWNWKAFLMGVLSSWVPPPEQLLFQQIVDFKRKAQVYFEGEKKYLTAATEFPTFLWGLRGTETQLLVLGACERAEVTENLVPIWWPFWKVCLDLFLFYSIWIESSKVTKALNFQMFWQSSSHPPPNRPHTTYFGNKWKK